MTHVLVMAAPLVVGLGLAWLAARRGWAPRLAVTLSVGVGLRAVVLLIAAQDTWQPYDLADDFVKTADYVLDGRDPLLALLEIREGGGWHFLPFMAYVLAGARELGLVLGVPWEVAARLGPVLTDLALIPLVGKLATAGSEPGRASGAAGDPPGEPSAQRGRRASDQNSTRRLRSFQYACAPLALMISAIHGQFVPITLLFGVAALVAARAPQRDRPRPPGLTFPGVIMQWFPRRALLAGLLIGLSVTATTWSVLLLPGVLLSVRGVRERLTVFALTGLVPLAFLLSSPLVLDTPLRRLPDSVKTIISARPVVGDWGWTALATWGEQGTSPMLSRIGSLVLLAAVIAAGWWWRRADPLDLTIALLLVFIVVTYRFGSQYLVWPLPFLIARPTRGTWPALTFAAIWAAFGYLFMTRLDYLTWGDVHVWWALSSLLVIAFLIRALPWQRRTVPETDTIPAIKQAAPT